MQKKIILAIAAFAMMGLSACGDTKAVKDESCDIGSRKCDVSVIYSCPEGTWAIESICNDGEECNPASLSCEAAVACNAFDKRCNFDKVEVCLNDIWVTEALCKGADVCNADTFVCETPTGNCTSDTKRCNFKTIEYCYDGNWQVEKKCTGADVCNADTYTCQTPTGACTSDTRRCNFKTVEYCNNGAWEVQTLCTGKDVCNADTFKCEDPTSICSAGTRRCNFKTVEICSEGAWRTERLCGDKEVCNADTFKCVDPLSVCTTGTRRCNYKRVERCVAGAWETEKLCTGTDVCDADTFTCENLAGACTIGAKRCRDSKLQVCVAEGWGTGMACSAGQECLDNGTNCTAIPGYCGKNADCRDPLYPNCNNNKCGCVYYTTTCKMVDGKGMYSMCGYYGEWDTYNLCDASEPVCNVEKTKCVGCTTSKQCNPGTENRNICNISTNSCVASPACLWYNSECVDNVYWKCDNDMWKAKTCSGVCTLNGCRCINGTTECLNNNLYTCVDGFLASPSVCGAGEICKDNDSQCTRSPYYCEGPANCKNPLYPECYMNVCICQDNQAACKIESGQAKYSNCADGVWNDYINCPSGMTKCNAAKTQCSN